MADRLLFLDFETYYDKDYSLRKMSTPAYIMDKRYETIMCAVRDGAGPSRIIDGPDFPEFIKQYDPATTVTVTYNALFDNSILALRYGFVPHRMVDVLGMARALLGHKLTSFTLANTGKYLGSGEKGDMIIKMMGKHRADLQAEGLWMDACKYCIKDNDICADIFKQLIPSFPMAEQRLMDLVLRCAIEPVFHTDRTLLCDHVEKVRADKVTLLKCCGLEADQVMSAAKFTQALKDLGVEISYKTSPTTKRQIPAIAKTDEFMYELQHHDDPNVQALAAARLGLKSTLEESRGIAFLEMSSLPWPAFRGGNLASMPVALKYGGAHTHRLSGEWGMNMQNMPRGSVLRKSLIAPPGHKVIVSDLGQIEARLVAWLCKQLDMLDLFAQGKDVYCAMASIIFGREITTADELERFVGKQAVLGLGYGMGVDKFLFQVIRDARKQKIDLGDKFDEVLANKTVRAYRTANGNIVGMWRQLDRVLQMAWAGPMVQEVGPVTVSFGKVVLPGDLVLNYNNPGYAVDSTDLIYEYGRFHYKMYGAKFLENIVQTLARIIIMNAALRLNARGYRFALQAHDELAFVVLDADVDNAKKIIYEEMTRRPSWAKDLPLKASMGVGRSYGEAK